MTLDSFFQRIDDDNRRRPKTHALESALTDRELLLWEKSHPGWTVPEELLRLLRRSNGFRLRLNKNSPGGADCCFRPLKDVAPAGPFMYGDDCDDDMAPKSWFAVAQDADGTSVLVVDMAKEEFLEVSPIDADDPTTLSKSVEGALNWLAGFFPDPNEGL